MSDWISVKDRLPEPGKEILVIAEGWEKVPPYGCGNYNVIGCTWPERID